MALIGVAVGYGQGSFRYQAELPVVQQDGFYRIVITPEIAARALDGLTDIRLALAASDSTIPFINDPAVASVLKPEFRLFPLLESGRDTAGRYFNTAENSGQVVVNMLELRFRNAIVGRGLSMFGSDDNRQWFAIKEHIPLESVNSDDDSSFVQAIPLPGVRYRYIRIVQEEKGLVPVKLLQAGIYKNDLLEGKFVLLPPAAITQRDSSNRKSYIRLDWKEPFTLDKLVLQPDGARFFHRSVSLYANETCTDILNTRLLRSGGTGDINVKNRGKSLWLVVENEDDQPLRWNRIIAYQLQQSVIAWLRAGEKYRLLAGDDSLKTPPQYDLKYFRDSLPRVMADIQPAGLLARQQPVKASSGNGIGKSMLWIAIIIVLALLTIISLRLAGDLRNRMP
ncbi:hypothetical protein FPE01S_04_00900 [Flavihumibacter petaseus NBRC 106054]|uniref:DUF3999 domain-containing protein n=1 Tax=Flavihumibacter petaseus NBRC 106054 TaxID=1220578 RepID=A0A0E9N4E3_9BACT|nr:hypothetical protein FPE01S_04_00900 [Flavihumibacter petaseus NBRC 106054]